MKNKGFLVVVFVLMALPLLAQNQEGSVAIANTIPPLNEGAVVQSFTKCVADLKATGLDAKEAVKACTKVTDIAASTAKRIANEAADATKASRPIVISSYGYGGYYTRSGRWGPFNYRYSYRRR